MKRALLSLVFLSAGLGACSDNPVGRLCYLGSSDAGAAETILASPALECQSRICLSLADTLTPANVTTESLCTAFCDSNDDCDRVDGSPCVWQDTGNPSGFVCMIPVTAGPFCCRKVCVCEAYLRDPAAANIRPAACDASIAQNECCNLSGRRGDPVNYPACN